jgi:DNA-binding NtrC family response regulator
MEEVRDLIRRVAATDARVLITGESGTGKELVAAAIHGLSERRKEPLVRVNCAAIPRELVESEMFGHEKGAFTGATRQRRGKFELAHRGTLFLDEVADLGHEAQAKLLRAIEAGEIERVGGSGVIPVDVRVIAATHRDLRAEVDAERFREDLFFRLHVMPIHLPPLRDRIEDLPLLAAHFLEIFRRRHGLRPPTLTDEALRALAGYGWPGNVRELANAVERLMILHPDDRIGTAEVAAVLPSTRAADPLDDDRPLSDRLDDHERRLIRAALTAAAGNVAEAARRLHTDRPNLYRRMRRLGIEHEDFRDDA